MTPYGSSGAAKQPAQSNPATPTVAFSIQGFGSTLIGKRDFWPDGSYLTTKWISLLWFPCLPLESLRVIPQGTEGTILHSKQHFVVLYKTTANMKQVMSTYVYVFGYALYLTSAVSDRFLQWLANPPEPSRLLLLLGIIVGPSLLPWCLRRRARRSAALSR
jgi:hypothetical protein